jgi:hypothetical protein
MDLRLAVMLLWALGSVTVWGLVVRDSLRSLHRYRDRRARRETIWAFALFLVGLASCVSILSFSWGADVPGLRGLVAAIALGSFLGAGIVVKTLSGPNNETRR